MTLESQPEPFRSLVLGVLRDFRRLFVPLVWFEILFKTAVAILSIVGGTVLLAILSRSTGSSAVTNSDIVDFLLSPVGVLVVAMLGFFTILFIILEHLGVMAILAHFQRGRKITALGISGTLAALVVPLLQIKAKGLVFLALTATPLAILGGLTYAALLSHHDINYYLANRPPSFLVAMAIGGLLGAAFLSILSYAYVRTVFLFPILLYEDLPASAALKESFRRTKGAVGRLGLILLGWQLGGVILSTAVVWGFAAIAGLLLHLVASRFWTLVPLVALLLALHGVILALLSFVLISLHCILIISLYRERNRALGVPGPEPVGSVQVVLDTRSDPIAPAILEDGDSGLAGRLRGPLRQRLPSVRHAGDRRGDGPQGLFLGRPREQPERHSQGHRGWGGLRRDRRPGDGRRRDHPQP